MTRVLWLLGYLALLIAIPLQLRTTARYIEHEKPRILTTPHELALIPLTFNIPEKAIYLQPYHGMPAQPSELKYVQALLPIYAGAFFFWFTGLFLYIFSRVRRLERAYILVCAFVTAYLLLFVDFFTQRYTGNFFLSFNIIVIAPFLYLYRSVYDLETRGIIYPFIIAAGFSVFFLLPVRSAADEILFIKILGGVFFAIFIYCAYLFIWFERNRGRVQNSRKLWAGRIFNLSLIFAVALPPAFFFMLYYTPVRIDINYNALFFLPALFPIIFLTLSLRWGLVSFHVPISLMAVRFMYFAFFGFLYWFTIGFSLGEIYQSETTRLGHFWILGLFLLLIDPFRTALLASLDSYTSARRKVLDSFLLQSSQQIANPRRVNHFIDRLAASLSEGLGTGWTKVIMSRDLFLGWDTNSDKVIYLPPDDPFWAQSRGRFNRGKYPVLTRTFIGPVRDFLQGHGGYLAVTMGKFKAGILIPERRENMPYYNEDIRFLRQIAREAEVLIQNYLFLIENVKLKRRERELADNARIQKRIIPGFREFERFSFWSYSHAYESVTGDYIDLMETQPGTHVVLLGDVSGHGISSGYLVSFARAYLRGALIDRKEPLALAIGGLNAYLAENYRGNEFITLFALQMRFVADSIELSYLNAGQHPALLYQRGRLTELQESQRLLGVTQHEYVETKVTLDADPARLILYSDGAFDVFNKSGKLLGQKRFFDWVESSLDKNAPDQLSFLRQRIESYTGSGDESDDLALIIIQTR
ncbi:MAG: serine/threonine-protein phosphatase [Turneriella sp.]|nr:serine/threonine-protein phosphatase [Turneriella sp.]